MSDERAPAPAEALARDVSLGAVLRTALTDPAALGPDDLAPIRQALERDGDDATGCERALDTMAAVLYARPDLVEDDVLNRLADAARIEPLPEGLGWRVGILFRFLAGSPAAPRAWAVLDGLLRDERVGAGTRTWLVSLVEDFVQWREDLVGLEGVLALAESPLLESHRAFLLDYGVERFVFTAPEAFTTGQVERIARLFAAAPRYRYVLYSLANRPTLAPGVRALLASRLAGRFPLHAEAAAILTARRVRLLMMQNIGLGQGDEIVRVVPLLQALLDANPTLTITVISRRPYLYDCPRVTPIAIDDDAAVQAALAEPFQGLFELFQPERPDFAYRLDLHEYIERVLAECRPPFVIRAELGRARHGDLGIPSAFLYETVELGGRSIAGAAGLDRRTLRSNYEPCLRLLAELGLPQRAGEEPALTPWLLAGSRSVDAERVWADLVAGERRPVALVNPFGGASAEKGFLDQGALLAREVEGLVDEGYRVVLLPNGTPWGGPRAIADALAQLSGTARRHVTVAPDPGAGNEATRLRLRERASLPDADRVVRLFKYFAMYADLVVTVEGWMAHMAYSLGRPFRLFLAAGSFTFDWYPHGRSRAQRLVASLSPRAEAAHWSVGLLREGDAVPLPHQPRKSLFELALAGLGRGSGAQAVAPLRLALASTDSAVRTWAVRALGLCGSATARPVLLAALEDSAPTVMREAARALLAGGIDCSRELGPRYRECLQAHADIVDGNWDAVGRIGAAALPVLFRVARGGNYVLSQRAQAMLRRVLPTYAPGLSSRIPEASSGASGW